MKANNPLWKERLSALGADGRLARFAVVGLLTTALDVGLFMTLTGVARFAPPAANICSYGAGIVVSFALNRLWTFAASATGGHVGGQAIRFLATYGVGLAFSTILVAVLSTLLAPPVAKLVSVPIVFIWHYSAARHWAFAAPKSPGGRAKTDEAR